MMMSDPIQRTDSARINSGRSQGCIMLVNGHFAWQCGCTIKTASRTAPKSPPPASSISCEPQNKMNTTTSPAPTEIPQLQVHPSIPVDIASALMEVSRRILADPKSYNQSCG